MTETAAYKELHRSRSDRMLAGVCGGLGEYFNVNPVFYRVGFVILTLLGGAGILVYGACLLVIPAAGERESIASDILRNHRQRPAALAGLILVAVAGVALLSHISFHFHSHAFWAIVLVLGAVLLWAQRRPETSSPPPPPATAPVSEPTTSTTAVTVPARRRGGALKVFAIVVGALMLAAVVFVTTVGLLFAQLSHGVGDKSFEPKTTAALRSEYKIGVGDLLLDLSQLTLAPGVTHIKLNGGIGHIEVIVPRDATVRAKAKVHFGEAQLLGHQEDGHAVTTDVGPKNAELVLDMHLGIGQAEVMRAG